MKNFRVLNNVFGWLTFLVAATTYLLTIEPTASFWDCGEFISAAFKLDVGHPPGAPFFMLVGRFFSLFASDVTEVARMVNSLSAILSALTILFLFWTITHLARKVLVKSEDDYTLANKIAIIGAGLVGALAYTFSDTFWFSAVEGEVYAFSSFFTAIVFWAILKWERVADREGSDRWLILIAYLMGLSIGVHLLNLLAIPALVLVYYYKNYTPSTKGVMIALGVAVVILGSVLYGLIPGCVEVASKFELLFVNQLGMPFNTGVYVYILTAISILVWAIYESYTHQSILRLAISFVLAVTIVGIPFFGQSLIIGLIIIAALGYFFYIKRENLNTRWINTALLMITVLMIGYSSYAVIVIRSSAKPTMDQNSPDNIFSLKYYLNREQYGDRPLLYGPVYSAPVKLKVEGNMCIPVQEQGAASYAPKPKESEKEKDSYVITGYKSEYEMDDKFKMLFPRMYSSNPSHINAYKDWGEVTGRTVKYDYCGEQKTEVMPTFGENLRFFVSYQINFMYWRYFMWNFSGRQNDLQSGGEVDRGNWITGINFIDEFLVGSQDNLPSELKNNKGRNTYFMLPLLLGLLGIYFLLNSGKKGNQAFWVTTLLFLLTGLAIVVYLNQTPFQPRERDYAYAGSFYAFSIWIGLGVLGLLKLAEKVMPRTVAAILVSACALAVPALMAQQNWDDHDRSNRYTTRDFGANYLQSTEKNAIIFSNGDNDTFPLWYNQEVEGVRTDVRVCNLSYLQTDWYIGQMKRGAYESAPLPISWSPKDFLTGKNEVLWVEDLLHKPLDVSTSMDFIKSVDPSTKLRGESFIPTQQLYIPVDAQQVIAAGVVPASRATEIVPQINIELGRRLTKSELMIIEMLNQSKWERPIYFAVTVGDDYYLGLKDHFELTGLAYKVVPLGVKGAGEQVNENVMFDNMMHKFKYGNVKDPKVYLDENTMRMARTHRMMFTQLIDKLIQKGDTTRAKQALDYCDKMIPGTTVPHDYTSTMLASAYYQIGENAKGDKIMDLVATNCVEYVDWAFSLSAVRQKSISSRIGQNVAILNQVLQICRAADQTKIFKKYLPKYLEYSKRYSM